LLQSDTLFPPPSSLGLRNFLLCTLPLNPAFPSPPVHLSTHLRRRVPGPKGRRPIPLFPAPQLFRSVRAHAHGPPLPPPAPPTRLYHSSRRPPPPPQLPPISPDPPAIVSSPDFLPALFFFPFLLLLAFPSSLLPRLQP